MNTLNENSSNSEKLILKKVKVSINTNKRLEKIRIRRSSEIESMILVDDNLRFIIDKGLDAVDPPKMPDQE
jgi:hypothetical protein